MQPWFADNYWFEAHGTGLTGWRIAIAATVGPIFPPAWWIAPSWKRDQWHRIACDDVACDRCADYYAESMSWPESADYYAELIDEYTAEYLVLQGGD